MRYRIPVTLLALTAFALTASGCGTAAADAAAAVAPAATITETFTGTINTNSAQSYPFTVLTVGTITATLTSVTPDATIPVGLDMGTWNGTSCQIIIDQENVLQSATVTGTATTTGGFCIRIFDTGQIVNPLTFSISITHS